MSMMTESMLLEVEEWAHKRHLVLPPDHGWSGTWIADARGHLVLTGVQAVRVAGRPTEEALAGDPAPDEERRHGVLVSRPTWLVDTERIQREVFKLEPRTVQYVHQQATAAVVEIVEILQLLPWKDARDGLDQGESQDIAALLPSQVIEKAQVEAVDALHFLANICVALGLDDRQLWEAYNRKTCKNVERRQRQERGERVDFH